MSATVDLQHFQATSPRRYGAVVARSVAEAEPIIASYPLPPGRFPPEELRLLVQAGGRMGLGKSPAEPSDLLHVSGACLFDTCVVARTVRLFDSPFSVALIRHLCGLVEIGGTLLLPVAGSARSEVLLSAAQLDEIMGAEGEPFEGYRCYLSPEALPETQSVFSWYAQNHPRLVYEQVLRQALGGPGAYTDDSVLGECLFNPDDWHAQFGSVDGFVAPEVAGLPQRLDNVASGNAYFINGIQYKAPIVAHILRQHLPAGKGLRMADIGGGFGALLAELSVTPGLSVGFAVTRDPGHENAILARHLCAAWHKQLAGRFFYALGGAEEFEFPRDLDVIMFVGSLLYVQRQHQVLNRAWDALAEGGLLIVHENIRAPSYVRDFDKMFEPDELNSLIETFGGIRYYLSTALAEIPQAKVERKTVFRVVQKSGPK